MFLTTVTYVTLLVATKIKCYFITVFLVLYYRMLHPINIETLRRSCRTFAFIRSSFQLFT